MIKNVQCPICKSEFGTVPDPSYPPEIKRKSAKYYVCRDCGVKLIMNNNLPIWELVEYAKTK